MKLLQLLDFEPDTLRWRCAHEHASGLDVLEIARPGLVLATADDAAVPREVFHTWMFANAERLLRAYVGFGRLEDHESDWLSQGVALIAKPVEPTVQMRGLALMTLASLNTFSALRHGPREMGSVYEWTGHALTWAAKRALAERRCPHDPVSLSQELVELHEALARFGDVDPAEARASERRAQLNSFIEAWREYLADD